MRLLFLLFIDDPNDSCHTELYGLPGFDFAHIFRILRDMIYLIRLKKAHFKTTNKSLEEARAPTGSPPQ